MVQLNLSERWLFMQPARLLHPMIPHSLAGVNPRRIKGKEWWDKTRKAAYAKNNYCCWACGVHKLDTEEQLLDGHETYEFDFEKQTVRYVETAALCRSCHMFIHFNTVALRFRRKRYIVRGLEFLRSAGIPLPYPQARAAAVLGLEGYSRRMNAVEEQKIVQLMWRRWTFLGLKEIK